MSSGISAAHLLDRAFLDLDPVAEALRPLDLGGAESGVAVEEIVRAGLAHVPGEAGPAGKLLVVGKRGLHQPGERGRRPLDLVRAGRGSEAG